MPRIGGQQYSAQELRAYFAANNPLQKAPESYTSGYVQRIASRQIRGEAIGRTVSRQEARRGGAPERPGGARRAVEAVPGFIGKVRQTAGGRFVAGVTRGTRQVIDTLAEFQRAGVERVRIFGTRIDADGQRQPFELGRKGGYTTAYLNRLVEEHGSWGAAMGYLISTIYGEDDDVDMGDLELVS